MLRYGFGALPWPVEVRPESGHVSALQGSCLTADPDGEKRGDQRASARGPADHGRRYAEAHLCILGRHHNVWKANPDGDRFKQCSRCGPDAGILANEGLAGRDTTSRATSAVALVGEPPVRRANVRANTSQSPRSSGGGIAAEPATGASS